MTVQQRLEYLRRELRAERISYGELHELQSLAEHIPSDDVELLQAAGVPECDTDHWSGPNGCHEDCPACANERI